MVRRHLRPAREPRRRLEHAVVDPRRLHPLLKQLPDSKVPWEFQSNRPDTDHFNRAFKPELARGGTEICRLNPRDGSMTPLTHSEPPVWDFRPSESPDGRQIIFCRAATGGVANIWIMDSDGRRPRLLTRGLEDKGADFPCWLPMTSSK